MSTQLDSYKVTDGVTPLAAKFFNAVFGDIDTRLVSLEDLKVSWEAAVDELKTYGLVRINAALQANFDEITALTTSAETTLGDIEQRVSALVTEADTAVTAANQAVTTAQTATATLEASAAASAASAAASAGSAASAVETAAGAHSTALLLAFALG
jgi:hypothetical protein